MKLGGMIRFAKGKGIRKERGVQEDSHVAHKKTQAQIEKSPGGGGVLGGVTAVKD